MWPSYIVGGQAAYVSGEGYPWATGQGFVVQMRPRVPIHYGIPYHRHDNGYTCGTCPSCRANQEKKNMNNVIPDKGAQLVKRLVEIDDDIKETMGWAEDWVKVDYRRAQLESDAREIYGVKNLPREVTECINKLLSMKPI